LKTLIVYPHGLGDCILATPAIREYKKQTGDFIGFATLERFRSAELFKNNPYVDEVIYTKDAWNDFPTFADGIQEVVAYSRECAKKEKYDRVIYIKHSVAGNKILDCFTALEISHNDDLHTEVYLTDEDHEWAEKRIRGREFGFVHSKTGVDNKDLPWGYGQDWIKYYFPDLPCFEPHMVHPITRGFALLKQASVVAVTDSVYYHAAGAMDVDVDLAYFARGIPVYNRVKPLHPVNQNIMYQLDPPQVLLKGKR
jgi:hypothetical protein